MVPSHILVQPRPDDVRADERAAYDRVVARQIAYGYTTETLGYVKRAPGAEAGPYFGALLRSPIIADHISELGAFYRTRGESLGSFAMSTANGSISCSEIISASTCGAISATDWRSASGHRRCSRSSKIVKRTFHQTSDASPILFDALPTAASMHRTTGHSSTNSSESAARSSIWHGWVT